MTDLTAPTKVLDDTNILIYGADVKAADKNKRASEVLEDLARQDRLVISVRVLNEFYPVATRPKKPRSLSHNDAFKIMQNLVDFADVLSVNVAVTLRALEAIPEHGFSFWDALNWAAANENEIPVVYTQDFQHGRDVDGVLIVNPFSSDARTGKP
jgi:predicted nucleic acid-binding protein